MVVLFKVWHVCIHKMLENWFLSVENTCSTSKEDGEKQFQIKTRGTTLMFIGHALEIYCLKNCSGFLYWFDVYKIYMHIIFRMTHMIEKVGNNMVINSYKIRM